MITKRVELCRGVWLNMVQTDRFKTGYFSFNLLRQLDEKAAAVNALIPSVYRMAGYVMGPQTALAYSGLQDYRARTGETRIALLFADRSPVEDIAMVSESMEMSEYRLREILGV